MDEIVGQFHKWLRGEESSFPIKITDLGPDAFMSVVYYTTDQIAYLTYNFTQNKEYKKDYLGDVEAIFVDGHSTDVIYANYYAFNEIIEKMGKSKKK